VFQEFIALSCGLRIAKTGTGSPAECSNPEAITVCDDAASGFKAVHVTCDADADARAPWQWEEDPPPGRSPKMATLPSPFRLILLPIVDHVLRLEKENPERTVAVVIPSTTERHWYQYFVHNQRGQVLTALLLLRGDDRINIVNVQWNRKL
jgi:hypothetical protein